MSSQLTPRSTGAAKTAFRTTVDDVNIAGASVPVSETGAAAMPPLPPSAQIFGMGMAAYVPQMLHVSPSTGSRTCLSTVRARPLIWPRRPVCTSARYIASCVRWLGWASSRRSPAGSSG